MTVSVQTCARLFLMTLVMGGCAPSPCPSANDNDNSGSTPVWREAFDAADVGFMSSVWGSSPENVFVVGGQPDRGVAYRFDGTHWEPMEIPDVPILVWVYGFGSDNVFAVGEQGGAIHYDGAVWRTMLTETEIDLWGVWGASPSEIWAVGGEIADGPPIILRFNGNEWRSVPVPELDRPSTALLKVWGTSSDHVFAVGQAGVILEFDGSQWRQAASGTSDDLVSLWGAGPDRILAVGGRSNGVIASYDGTGWTSRSAAPLPGLNGVFVEVTGEAVVVGLIGSAAATHTETLMISPEDTPTALTLHAVWADGAGVTYAVGGRTSETPYRGVALVRTRDDE